MSEHNRRNHPDEAIWIAWLDEAGRRDPDLERHLESCETCASRVRELRAVLDGLAGEPPTPGAEALAANRERIRQAIGTPAGSRASPPAWHPAAWAAVLAAAALAALLLWSPRGPEPPASISELVTAAPGSPDLARDRLADEAERAAEAVVAAALPTAGPADDAEATVLDDAAAESLAELQATTPTLADESTYESTELAERFASLPEEDRIAILDELSDLTLEL